MGMSKKAIALTLVLSLLASMLIGAMLTLNGVGTIAQAEQTSSNNTIVEGNTNATVTIQSPRNETYNKNNVTLAFTIESYVVPMENFSGGPYDLFLRHGCVLDYSTANLVNTIMSSQVYSLPDNVSTTLTGSANLYVGNATLTDLSQGEHNVTVWIRPDVFMLSYSYPYGWAVFTTVSFNIDSISPNISVLSPETKVYNASNVPLDFTVNKTVSQITYSLDGHQNITTSGNLTLHGLFNGAHNVTVYATDEAGSVGSSQTISFTVAKPEPFPVVPVAVAGATVAAVVCAGLIVYIRKRSNSPLLFGLCLH